MTEGERHALIGKLVSELVGCVQDLNRARDHANDLAPTLRSLADCFDKQTPEARIASMRDSESFTPQAPRERRTEWKLRGVGKRIDDTGEEVIDVPFPSEADLAATAQSIRDSLSRAEELMGKLKNEHVDIRAICAALTDC